MHIKIKTKSTMCMLASIVSFALLLVSGLIMLGGEFFKWITKAFHYTYYFIFLRTFDYKTGIVLGVALITLASLVYSYMLVKKNKKFQPHEIIAPFTTVIMPFTVLAAIRGKTLGIWDRSAKVLAVLVLISLIIYVITSCITLFYFYKTTYKTVFDFKKPDQVEVKNTKKKKMTSKRKKELIFVIVLLAFPVLQFLATWIFVNSYSIILAFENVSFEGEVTFAGFSNFLKVIENIFDASKDPIRVGSVDISSTLMIFLNSLGYTLITIFVSLPLALISSYFLSKKMPLANVFRVIFFLPNIISTVALVYAFRMQTIDPNAGLLYQFFKSIGITHENWPSTTTIVYIYCIWAGLGYNVLLLSGAIGRIPKELFESAQMDGAGSFKEFTRIMIPMIWPTVVTLVVLGLTSILTLYLQPYLFNLNNNETIAGAIFNNVSDANTVDYPYYAAFGLLFSFVLAPLILYIRKVISKKYSDTDC